jgi:P-type conjugative transfer protein TrbL
MNPASGILTQILQAYAGLFTVGIGSITVDAMAMLEILTFFSILFTGFGMLEGHLTTYDGLWKIIKVGGLIWIVSNYQSLIKILLKGFVYLGSKAGGGTVAPVVMDNPSAIAERGMQIVEPYFNNIQAVDAIMNLPGILYSVLAGVIIVLSFFAIGVRMFLVYVSFYTIAVLGLFFLPGAAISFTRPLAESVISGLMKEGFKFMVLAFLVSVLQSMVSTWALPPEPSFADMSFMWFGTLTLAFLCWYLPGVVSSFFTGTIHLSRKG